MRHSHSTDRFIFGGGMCVSQLNVARTQGLLEGQTIVDVLFMNSRMNGRFINGVAIPGCLGCTWLNYGMGTGYGSILVELILVGLTLVPFLVWFQVVDL